MLELTAFVAGASIMAIEIVASRILAPYLGNSIVVWSSLIGVILASLSWGYVRGGRAADRNPDARALARILAIAAVLTALIALGRNACLALVAGIPDIRVASVAAELLLFAPVSFVLAMVSPYVIRLKVQQIGSTGETVGRLYAISTLGSIVGTFSAGFWLLAYIGSMAILLCIAALLFVTSVALQLSAARGRKAALDRRQAAAAAMIAFSIAAAPRTSLPFVTGNRIFETDTHYNHALVYESADRATGRPIRSLVIDRYSRQSSVFLDRNDDLVLDYLKFFRLGRHFVPNGRRDLLLGGGGFTFVGDYLKRNPEGRLDVVELDPAFEPLARRYFGLMPDPRVRIYAEDARVFLNRPGDTYDVIYLDTFGSQMMVPFYMTTRQTAQRVFDRLSAGGVALLNTMSAIDGPQGRFLRAEVATYRSVFPRVEVFKTSREGDRFANVMIAAFRSAAEPEWTSSDPETQRRLQTRWTAPIAEDMAILTDDYAPVEIYMSGAGLPQPAPHPRATP
jgi:spermidine synthase